MIVPTCNSCIVVSLALNQNGADPSFFGDVLDFFSRHLIPLLLLAGSAIGIGTGVSAATTALGDGDRPRPGLIAILYSLMTAFVAIATIVHGTSTPSVAVSVCFSANVVALTMGLGTALFVAGRATKQTFAPAVGISRRATMLLPVSLIVLMVGFSGLIGTGSATILVLEGVALLPLCAGPLRWKPTPLKVIQLIVGISLIAVSAWVLTTVSSSWASRIEILRPGLLSSLVLGPLIVLPMVPTVATLAETGFTTEAIDAVVMFVMLNSCAVLPLLAAIQPGVAFPMLSWRLDAVLMVVVAALLMPASLGKWSLGRAEGLVLLGMFVAYLMVTMVVTLN